MLSIDEAIEHAREVAEEQRELFRLCPYPSQECNGADICKCLKNKHDGCIKCAEEHEQLASWLEELKALREEKSDFQIMAKDIAEGNYEMGMENGYNEAIDDAKSVILQTLDNEILVDTLHLRLEQLKERNNE